MPCIPIKSNTSCRTDWLCVSGAIYEFDGYRFEIHSQFGPVRLTKNDNMHSYQPAKFFDAVERWQALSADEREKYKAEE